MAAIADKLLSNCAKQSDVFHSMVIVSRNNRKYDLVFNHNRVITPELRACCFVLNKRYPFFLFCPLLCYESLKFDIRVELLYCRNSARHTHTHKSIYRIDGKCLFRITSRSLDDVRY